MYKKSEQSVKLRDRIKNNILVLLVTFGVTVAGATTGVMKYFSDQHREILQAKHDMHVQELTAKHAEKLAKVNARLRSIERRLGNNDFFDIRKFFIDDARKLQLSKKAQFHEEDRFYASRDSKHWHYMTLSEIEFAGHILGEENPLYKSIANMSPQSQSFGLVHIWKGTDEKLVEGPSPVRRLFPYIAVERISYDDLFGQINEISRDLVETLSLTTQPEDTEEIADFVSGQMSRMYRGDAVGAILSNNLLFNYMMTNMFPNVTYFIKNLRKIGNVVYLQSVTTLSDVTIDDERHANYFVTTEQIMISTDDALYILQTSVPNHEPAPRDEYFVRVDEWLHDFAVLIK